MMATAQRATKLMMMAMARWATTTMATARRATKLTMMATGRDAASLLLTANAGADRAIFATTAEATTTPPPPPRQCRHTQARPRGRSAVRSGPTDKKYLVKKNYCKEYCICTTNKFE
jgi:hypothetical protein